MTDIKALNQYIDASGIKKGKICEAVNLTYPRLQRKLDGTVPLTVDEAHGICKVMHITDPETIVKLFFA